VLDVLFAPSQQMPADRTVIYNRRVPSAGPVYYADDSLEAELNMGRDIKIQTEENDSSSVASYELVFACSVYLLVRNCDNQQLSEQDLIHVHTFQNYFFSIFFFLKSCDSSHYSENSRGFIFQNNATKEFECLHVGYWPGIIGIINN